MPTCPRCQVPLTENGPLDVAACARCGGGLLPQAGAERLLFAELGLSLPDLKELASLVGGQRLVCGDCDGKMRPLVLRGEQVDLCFGCGALWVDRDELEALSDGRYALPPVNAARAPPPPQAARVRIDSHAPPVAWSWRAVQLLGLCTTLLAVVGVVGVSPALWGLSAFAVATLVRARRTVIELYPRARKMLLARGNAGAQRLLEKHSEAMPAGMSVVAFRKHAWRLKLPLYDVALVDAEGRRFAMLDHALPRHRLTERLERHRRLLGAPARIDGAASVALLAAASHEAFAALRAACPKDAPLLFLRSVKLEGQVVPGQGRTVNAVNHEGNACAVFCADDMGAVFRPTLRQMLHERFALTLLPSTAGPLLSLPLGSRLARADTLVVHATRTLGHVRARAGTFFDEASYYFPQRQQRLTVRAWFFQRTTDVVDGEGRVVAMLRLQPHLHGRPTSVELCFQTDDAVVRMLVLVLVFHLSLCGAARTL